MSFVSFLPALGQGFSKAGRIHQGGNVLAVAGNGFRHSDAAVFRQEGFEGLDGSCARRFAWPRALRPRMRSHLSPGVCPHRILSRSCKSPPGTESDGRVPAIEENLNLCQLFQGCFYPAALQAGVQHRLRGRDEPLPNQQIQYER